MAQLPVFSAKNVKVAYLGYTLDGLSPDSFVEFSLSTNLTDEEVGADGSVSISMSPDETGTCTISLQQNSPSNIFLSGLLARQRVEGKLASGALSILDPSGSVVAVLSKAHIKTAPTIGLGSTATGKTHDWVFFCQSMLFTSVPEGVVDDADLLTPAVSAAASVDVTKFL